jgi:methionyl-tRNA formyltransferase
MFDTIILLTGAAEQRPLGMQLSECNRDLALVPVDGREALFAIPPTVLARARLIGFATPVIVPPRVLDALGGGAFNFHPGPPNYPGLVPAQLAIYEGAATFGVTAHRMVAEVDAGPIIATTSFDVTPGTSLHDLEATAYRALARLFWELSPRLAQDAEIAELPLQWGQRRNTRRSTEAMCEIPVDIPKPELDRRVAAFASSPFGIGPTVTLHGYRFKLIG